MHETRAQFDGAGKHGIDGQIIQTDRCTKNVDNRIGRTNFVESDFVDCDTVNARFSLGENTEDEPYPPLDAFLER